MDCINPKDVVESSALPSCWESMDVSNKKVLIVYAHSGVQMDMSKFKDNLIPIDCV